MINFILFKYIILNKIIKRIIILKKEKTISKKEGLIMILLIIFVIIAATFIYCSCIVSSIATRKENIMEKNIKNKE